MQMSTLILGLIAPPTPPHALQQLTDLFLVPPTYSAATFPPLKGPVPYVHHHHLGLLRLQSLHPFPRASITHLF